MTNNNPTRRTDTLDEALVSLAMDGDLQAFEQLYRRWHLRLLRHANRLLGEPEQARDVVQLAALAIARNIHRLKSPAGFGPWAYTIVRNRAADQIKRNQRDRALKDAVAAVPTTSAEADPNQSRSHELRDLIASLAPIDREILSAFYLDQMSLQQITDCFDIPIGTAKSRLHNARNRLRTTYQAIEGDHHE